MNENNNLTPDSLYKEDNQNQDVNIQVGSLYELNQQLLKNKTYFHTLSHLELAAIRVKLEEWFADKTYVMLLCNDIHYFTLFQINSTPTAPMIAAQECIGCLEDQQMDIISFETQKDDSWEIWLRPSKGEPMAFYLFDYSKGVINCE